MVLNNGGVLEGGTWLSRPAAVIEAWLAGEGYAAAVADVLFGVVNPSGKLPETIPHSVRDTPSFLDFPGRGGRAFHGEGVFVGYRGYDLAATDVAFPFGHGLSYTTFSYDDLVVHDKESELRVAFTITNTGDREGDEIWQLYVEPPTAPVQRPVRTLAAFGKVHVQPGGSVRVETVVDPRAFARWDEQLGGWCVDGGQHQLVVGASSRDLRASTPLHRTATAPVRRLNERSTLREWTSDPVLGSLLLEVAGEVDTSGATVGFLTNPVVATMIGDIPICRLFADPTTELSAGMLEIVTGRQGHGSGGGA